jgi:aspartyl-tRNA(Asn)/glutamyl-tRNA(Gln) amidotransferase subunit C
MSDPSNPGPGPHIDVAHIARLARLHLSAEEAARLESQLGSILGYIAQLSEVNVAGVEPMTHAADLTMHRALGDAPAQSLRSDEVHPPLGPEGLTDAPSLDGTLVEVPRIIGAGGSGEPA